MTVCRNCLRLPRPVERVKSRLTPIVLAGIGSLRDTDLDHGSGLPMLHDSMDWRQVRDAKLLEWFDGDASAVEFVVALSSLAELWDDLIDKDKEPQDINQVFWNAMVVLPCNEFFNAHKAFLMPLIIQSINAFHDSVELEKGDTDDRAYALTLRNLALQIVPMVVFLKKGFAASRQVSLDSWRFFTQHDDAMSWIKGK